MPTNGEERFTVTQHRAPRGDGVMVPSPVTIEGSLSQEIKDQLPEYEMRFIDSKGFCHSDFYGTDPHYVLDILYKVGFRRSWTLDPPADSLLSNQRHEAPGGGIPFLHQPRCAVGHRAAGAEGRVQEGGLQGDQAPSMTPSPSWTCSASTASGSCPRARGRTD